MSASYGLRLVSVSGNIAPNSTLVETARRFVQLRLPGGSAVEIAQETQRAPRRVNDEVEGAKLLSVDVLLRAGAHLSLEERIRLFQTLLGPLNLSVTAAPLAPLELIRMAA